MYYIIKLKNVAALQVKICTTKTAKQPCYAIFQSLYSKAELHEITSQILNTCSQRLCTFIILTVSKNVIM